MSAIFQAPPPGTFVAPPPGGIVGKPPNGFVYPYWLPHIPGTVIPLPKVIVPDHECPIAVFQPLYSSSYSGSVHDEIINYKHIKNRTLRDCAVSNCSLEDCTLVDCLLTSCILSNCKLNDVELKSTKCFKSAINDVKASADCRFGFCGVTEADATDCRLYKCDVKSSELKKCKAWDTRFNDATVKEIQAYGACVFTDCGGDVPKMASATLAATPAPSVAPAYVGVLPSLPDCPKERIPCPSGLSAYRGSGVDDSISRKTVVGETLSDCELKNCWVDGSTLTDCLLIDCLVNGGKLKDVELRSTLAFRADIDDVKAISTSKFGQCTIHEGDVQNCHLDQCTVTSSEVTQGIAWDTKFRDVTLKKVETKGKCKFALCGGDVPKKDDSDDEDENNMGGIPAPYNPNPPTLAGSSGTRGVDQSAAPYQEGVGASGAVGGYTYQFSPASASDGQIHTVPQQANPSYTYTAPQALAATAAGYRMPTYASQNLAPDTSL